MAERAFKGIWIPKSVWLDERLNALEKVILMEIDSLDQSEKGCFAGNDKLAAFCQCSETKVSKSISKLIELGYIRVQNFDGRQRELKSNLPDSKDEADLQKMQSSLAKNARQTCKKDEAAMQKMQDSNTYNNTFNNTSNRCVFKPPTLAEVEAYCNERKNGINPQRFIDYYTARGWMVGKSKMKDWKAAVRLWEQPKDQKPKNTEPDILDGIL